MGVETEPEKTRTSARTFSAWRTDRDARYPVRRLYRLRAHLLDTGSSVGLYSCLLRSGRDVLDMGTFLSINANYDDL